MFSKNVFKISTSTAGQAIVLVIWAVLCYVFFETQYHYHFFYQEQNQLFLLSSDYLMTYFSKPAWLACMAGDFLTQFYYYLYAGPAILTVALMVMGDMMCRGMKCSVTSEMDKGKKRTAVEWILFAVAIFIMTVVAYLSLYEEYKLRNVLALAGGGAAWWIAEKIIMTRRHISAYLISKSKKENDTYQRKSHITHILLMIIASVLTYWMCGIGVWWFMAMILIKVVFLSRDKLIWGLVYLGISLIVTLTTINALTSSYYLNFSDAALYPGLGKWVNWSEEKIVESNLAYDNEYYLGNYDKVIKMFENENVKTDEMSFFYCLALEQKGLLASKLPQIQNPNLGTFLKIDDKTPLFTIKMINELYYLLGDMTYTERAALLACTFSPEGRNVRMVKRMAEANLVTGDYPAAMKYLRLLSKTFVYKEWANHMIKFTKTNKASSPATADIVYKRQFINKTDNIRLGDDCYVILTQLLDSNPENMAALDYLLCSDMLSKQRDVFIRDYEKYGTHARTFFKDIYESAKAE